MKGDKTMSNQNNQGNQNGNNLPANNGAPTNPPANGKKGGLKGFLNGIHRKYDAIRYSKAGKWIMRGLTVAAFGTASKVAYDKGVAKGKASVVPTVVTIQPIEPEEEATGTPAEESAVEEV